MIEIENKEDLPNHVKLFARVLEGELSNMPQTKFFEMESITELELEAVNTGYEIVPTMDGSTGRGFLVGFNATESRILSPGLTGVGLNMYFIEITEDELKEWTATIKQHRADQEQDMFNRRERVNQRRKT